VKNAALGIASRLLLVIAAAGALVTGACGSLQGNALAGVPGGTSTFTKTESSSVFGFAVDVPANWRRSDVLSTIIAGDPIFLGHEVFTSRTVSEEEALLEHDEWMGPAWGWTVIVVAHNNPQQLSAAQWATSIHAGAREGQVIENLTFAGQNAVRITGGARFRVQYFINYKGVMYLVAYNTHRETATGVDENTLKAIVASFRFTR
jgi:hypothetical protein